MLKPSKALAILFTVIGPASGGLPGHAAAPPPVAESIGTAPRRFLVSELGGDFQGALARTRHLPWVELIVDGPASLTGDVELGAGVHLAFWGKRRDGTVARGSLDLAGHRLTLRGGALIAQPRQHIFLDSSEAQTGAVDLSRCRTTRVHPQWWGALDGGEPAQSSPCQKALDSGARTIRFQGRFDLERTLLVASHTMVDCTGGASFHLSIPGQRRWFPAAAKEGRGRPDYLACTAFVNRNGFLRYNRPGFSLAARPGNRPIGFLDEDIHFTGTPRFTASAPEASGVPGPLPEYEEARGPWAAIAMAWVKGFSIEALDLDGLNGLFTYESAHGRMGRLRGRNARNFDGDGGVALVGYLSRDLHFKSVEGVDCAVTFVVDGEEARHIRVDRLQASDTYATRQPDPDGGRRPRALRHVECCGVSDLVISNLDIRSGGTYQCLKLGARAFNVRISGAIANAWAEPVRIQDPVARLHLDLRIAEGWEGRKIRPGSYLDTFAVDPGRSGGPQPEGPSAGNAQVRPAVLVFHRAGEAGNGEGHRLRLDLRPGATGAFTHAVLEAFPLPGSAPDTPGAFAGSFFRREYTFVPKGALPGPGARWFHFDGDPLADRGAERVNAVPRRSP